MQKRLPIQPWEQSDTDGLTLNINVPIVDTAVNLPVLVFVPGGGFTSGSADYPEYDLARITQMSVDLGQPMLSVGVKYGCLRAS